MNPNVELVRRHYEDFINRGEMGAADRDLRADFVDHAAPPDAPPGPDTAKRWIEAVRTGFPDIAVHDDVVIAQGDMVAVLATWRGTHTGHFLGFEPTGRTVEMQGIVLWRVHDAQLAERWAVLDYDSLFAAIETSD